VIMLDKENMLNAKRSIMIDTSGRAKVTCILADLKSFSSVREAASEVRSKTKSIDVLILNAGIAVTDLELIDGIESIQVFIL